MVVHEVFGLQFELGEHQLVGHFGVIEPSLLLCLQLYLFNDEVIEGLQTCGFHDVKRV